MTLRAFTIFHVALSLVGIAAGFVVLCGMLKAKQSDGWTELFLATTVTTTVTGFLSLFTVSRPLRNHPSRLLNWWR